MEGDVILEWSKEQERTRRSNRFYRRQPLSTVIQSHNSIKETETRRSLFAYKMAAVLISIFKMAAVLINIFNMAAVFISIFKMAAVLISIFKMAAVLICILNVRTVFPF